MSFCPQSCRVLRCRTGKVLVAFVLILSTLFAVIAYFVDGSMMLLTTRKMQSATDAAATAAALDVMLGEATPEQTAEFMVRDANSQTQAGVTTRIPPASGEFAGRDGYVEVTVDLPYEGYFLRAAGLTDPVTLRTRAVAGTEAATAAAAVVVLDPNPSEVTLGALPVTLPSINPVIGGLEVVGLGRLDVDGAILVNNTWDGLDENGDPVGSTSPPLASACTCTPVLPLTRVRAHDIRVVGGVDDPDNYAALESGEPSPLRANRRPVRDPLLGLPAPTSTVDPTNVRTEEFGGVTIAGLPIPLPPRVLEPGVYEWLDIVGGRVDFEPGVYIIRSRNPLTGLSLSIVGARINAEGVMFYLTDSESYSPMSGVPDMNDGESEPPTPTGPALVPSVVLASLLFGSRFSGIDDANSPFHGMLFYQRRWDRRPMILVKEDLLGTTVFTGNVYAKWANLVLAGNGRFQSALAVGSLRVVTALEIRIEPLAPLPPAYDVFLVE